MAKVERIDMNEVKQLVEDLFKYIKLIDLGIAWDYEFIREQSPALSFKQVSTSANKIQQYIAGGYDAELPFIIYHKNKVVDKRKALDITKPFNMLDDIFKKEVESNFQNLIISDENITPVSLEMISTPEDATGIENNVATYVATYRLIYHKKGRFE